MYQQQHVVVCVIACVAVCDDVVSCACVCMYIGSSIISKQCSICTTCGGWWYVLPCYVVWIATDGMYAIYVVVAISGLEV